MSFAQILEEALSSPESAENGLADGQFTLKYPELPALLARVDQLLGSVGIDSSASVAVECDNSVASALVLLALLRRGASFVLSPQGSSSNDRKPAPHFCRGRLFVGAGERNGQTMSYPERFIRAEQNPRYNGKPADPERLYLRTSGSMGESKIVVHTYGRLIGNARNCIEKYRFNSRSRCVIPVPIAHMYGFGAEFLPAILSGASIDFQDKTNLLKYLERERRFQPTIAFATPAVCEMLLKGYKSPRTIYDVFVTSGQSVNEETFRAFDRLLCGRLINQYGSTEMGAIAACNPGDGIERRATSIGEPMSGVKLRLEPLNGHPGAAETGKLYCRHPYGFVGYVDENGEWLYQNQPDGWFSTGDLAATGPDRCLRVIGRADDSVNRSGYLVLLPDIERMMQKLESIREVAVVAIRGESRHGQRIAAFCVPQSGLSLTGREIRRHCFDLLPRYALPDEVHVLHSLPLLPSGKLDRQILLALIE